MAHASLAFTDPGTSIREHTKNISGPAVDHASHFEQLRFMREDQRRRQVATPSGSCDPACT